MIKMLIFDVDGTLYDLDDHCVYPSTIEAIKQAKQAGYLFTIASGRCHYAINQALLNLQPDYILGISGAVLANNKQEVIKCVNLNPSTINDLIIFAKKHEAGLVLKCLDKMYFYFHEEKIDWLEGQKQSDLPSYIFHSHPSADIHLHQPVQGGCIHLAPALIEEFMKAHNDIDFIQYSDDGFDFVAKDCNKGVGVEMLADYLHLSLDEICCIGDNLNDIPMFNKAGFSIAMGNGVDELKKIADYVCQPSNKNGIQSAINYLLNLKR